MEKLWYIMSLWTHRDKVLRKWFNFNDKKTTHSYSNLVKWQRDIMNISSSTGGSVETHRDYYTGSNAWLIGNNSHSPALHSSEPDYDVLGIVGHNLKEISLVNDLQETVAVVSISSLPTPAIATAWIQLSVVSVCLFVWKQLDKLRRKTSKSNSLVVFFKNSYAWAISENHCHPWRHTRMACFD